MNQQNKHKETVIISNPDWMIAVLGQQDQHLEILAEYYPVTLSSRGEELVITGEATDATTAVAGILQRMVALLMREITPRTMDLMTAIKMEQQGKLDEFLDLYDLVIGRTHQGQPIRVKNFGQRQYVEAIQHKDLVFGIGPAGTGKTYVAVTMAVQALREGQIRKIILTRPAVEAGESLGFLPGDLKEKVDPYLRPIYDALYSVCGLEQTARLMERGVIEVAPLAYMRGRTLDDAFVILDEAQNTTISQMKMFLTRLGFGSKMIINGDISQIDLPRGVKSGLSDARHKLSSLSRVSFVTFDEHDVVRHPVVADVIRAYEQFKE